MPDWTEASFDADPELLPEDAIAWLAPRSGSGSAPRLGRLLDVVDRTGTAVGKVVTIMAVGCVLSGSFPGLAIAPVGKAHASVDRLLPMPAAPDAVSIAPALVAIESAEPRRADRLDAGRSEVEEFLRFGSRALPRRLVDTIVRAANATGVDPIYLMALADKESSFRTDVKASTSSAQGLFQFVDRTWLETVRRAGARHGLDMEADAITILDDKPVVEDESERARILDLRSDPYLAAVMAAELLKRDAAKIGFRIGRQLNRTEMYLAHFLGLEDAARFIEMRGRKRPANAAASFPAAARANAAIFFEKQRRRRRGLSVPEVYAKIDQMMERRVERYQDVEQYAAASGT